MKRSLALLMATVMLTLTPVEYVMAENTDAPATVSADSMESTSMEFDSMELTAMEGETSMEENSMEEESAAEPEETVLTVDEGGCCLTAVHQPETL